jgi:proteasome lid subunit RPN8/RPN11
MKRGPKTRETRQAEPVAAPARIEMKSQVLQGIRQHARSSMGAEICGVLIGGVEGGRTVVEASIPGEEARQGGSHVTFTQDTWAHIYQVKDAQYPDRRIVGWYHSHPGFGVFLSEHDTFIHRNFFSDPSQIAWVYDPHSDEEGCFAWQGEDLKRVADIALRDDRRESEGTQAAPVGELADEAPAELTPEAKPDRRRIMGWVGLLFSHLFALVLGLAAGALLAPQVIVVPERAEPRPALSSPAPQPGRQAVPGEGQQK